MHPVPWQIVTNAPRIASGEIHIWRYRLELSTERVGHAESLLSADELARADRFHFPIHRERYVAGRSKLRKLLGSYLQVEPASVRFTYSEFGRPALNQAQNSGAINFNVSHSEDICLVAVSHVQPLGIDVERIRGDFGGEEVAQANFAPAEFRELLSLPSNIRPQGFFNCWTRKEAYVKALGAGLQIPLDSFEVSLRPEDSPRFLRGAGVGWHLLSFCGADGFQAAAAYRGTEAVVQFYEFSENDFVSPTEI